MKKKCDLSLVVDDGVMSNLPEFFDERSDDCDPETGPNTQHVINPGNDECKPQIAPGDFSVFKLSDKNKRELAAAAESVTTSYLINI